jgi:hypothetical protein
MDVMADYIVGDYAKIMHLAPLLDDAALRSGRVP